MPLSAAAAAFNPVCHRLKNSSGGIRRSVPVTSKRALRARPRLLCGISTRGHG